MNDYLVHGQVAIRNGTIKTEPYNVEQHGECFSCDGQLGARNGVTWVGSELVGSGQEVMIHYSGAPTIISAQHLMMFGALGTMGFRAFGAFRR